VGGVLLLLVCCFVLVRMRQALATRATKVAAAPVSTHTRPPAEQVASLAQIRAIGLLLTKAMQEKLTAVKLELSDFSGGNTGVAKADGNSSAEVEIGRLMPKEPLEFLGSNTDGGCAFADTEKAEKMLKEVALVLHTANSMLDAEALEPWKLWVEGHTSKSQNGQEESIRISLGRAEACCAVLKSAMKELDSTKSTSQIDKLFSTEGHGDARPLAGFADGGNYPENRRVELSLMQ